MSTKNELQAKPGKARMVGLHSPPGMWQRDDVKGFDNYYDGGGRKVVTSKWHVCGRYCNCEFMARLRRGVYPTFLRGGYRVFYV